MNLDELIEQRLAQGLCVGCGKPLEEEKLNDWTTCLPCQERMEQEAHAYWSKVYRAESN